MIQSEPQKNGEDPLDEGRFVYLTPGGCPPLKRGSNCPACGQGQMDYDTWLVLTCPECGYQQGFGGYT